MYPNQPAGVNLWSLNFYLYYSVGVEFALEYVHIILTNLDTSIKADRVIRNVNYHDLTSLMTYIHTGEINSIFSEKEIPVERASWVWAFPFPVR